jgi:preprotein translocase subunit SecG
VHSAVTWFTSIVWLVSTFAMVAGILLHSGRGGGLSDMFGGGGGAGLGSTAAESNLNRITLVFATVWMFSTIILGLLLN